MDNELFSIGDIASQSGLSVSALRFYDRVGMLNPAWVDPSTSYRWYSTEQIRVARLLASLRRVGLALPEMSRIMENLDDQPVVDSVLQEHVQRLEQGLTAAKAAIEHIGTFWQPNDDHRQPLVASAPASDLLAALKSVRFALGDDQEFPALKGILLELSQGQLRLTASDRFRAAFASVATSAANIELKKVLDGQHLGSLMDFLARDGAISLTFGTQLSLAYASDGEEFIAEFLDVDFPDLSNIVPDAARSTRLEVDRAWLREKLAADSSTTSWFMRVDEHGNILLESGGGQSSEPGILLGAEYLADAIEAVDSNQLSIELNGPIAPLAIRPANDSSSFSILMPMRQDVP